MGKKKANVAADEESGEMDMSPMIDMVFLLLIFFVVNATAITVKKDKNIQMPTASSSGEVKSANGCIVVNVYGEGDEYYESHCGFYDIRDICRIDPDIVRFLNLPYGTMQMRSEDGAWYEVIRDDEGEEET